MLGRLFLFLCLVTSSLFSSTIEVKSGWNLLGSNLDNINPSTAFSSCKSVWKYDKTTGWSAISPDASLTAALTQANIASFTKINGGDGYWVQCDNAMQATLNGTTPADIKFNLPSSGWYLKSLKGTLSINAESFFKNSDISIIWKYLNGWKVYSPSSNVNAALPISTSRIDTIDVNEGFWINANGLVNLDEASPISSSTSRSALATPIAYVPTGTLKGSINLNTFVRSLRAITDGGASLWVSADGIASSLIAPAIGDTTTLTPSPFISRKVTINSDGTYEVSGLPSGQYSIIYVSNSNTGVKIDSINILPSKDTTQNITSDDVKSLGSVTLNVASLTGSKLSGTNIRLNELDISETTDQNGDVSFVNLPQGTYSLTVSKNGYVSKYMTFNIIASQTTNLQTIELNSQRGTITGIIEIPGALNNANALVYLKAKDGTVLTTITDAVGNYQIPSVPVGENYSIIATAHDTQSAKVDGLSVSYGSTTVVPTISLSEKTIINSLKSGTIQGYARYSDISLLSHEGIIVSIEGTDLEALTARDGSYIINNIPVSTGNYTINFTESRYVTQTTTTKVIEGSATFIDDITLQRAVGTVTGKIVDGIGNGVSNANISLISLTSTVSGNTDSSGNFTITGVPAGAHTLKASKTGFGDASIVVNINASQSTQAGNVSISEYKLSGTVNLDGTTDESGATVSVVGTNIQTTTAANGSFTLYGLTPKTYQIQVTKAGYLSSDKYLVTIDSLNQTYGQTIPLTQAKGTLSGIVKLSGSDDNSGVSVSIAGVGSVTTNALGIWSIDLPINSYTNDITFSHANYQTQTYTNSFTVNASTATQIAQISMDLNLGILTGKVVDDSNLALEGATIVLSSGINNYSTQTNTNGTFSMNVAVGTYIVTALKTGYGNAQTNDVVVTYNTTNQTLSTSPMQLASNKISGVINVEGSNDNKTGVTVQLINISDSTVSSATILNDGSFTINAVRNGNYKLIVSHSSSDYASTILELYNIDSEGYIFATPIVINKKAITKDYDMLTFNYIKGQNSNSDTLKYNLFLPTTMPNGSSISWSSDNTALISNNGFVILPSSTASNTLNLTATVSYSNETNRQKTFALAVLKDYQPTFDLSTTTISVNEDFGYIFKSFSASNANGENILYSIENITNQNLIDNLVIDSSTGETTLKSKLNANGMVTFNVKATSGTPALSSLKSVTVNISPISDTLSSNVGTDTTVSPNTLITLNSSASIDIDGDATYSWILSKPNGSTAVLSSATAANPTFTPDKTGTYTATLTMTNGVGSSNDSIVYTVLPTISISDIAVSEGSNAVFTVNIGTHDNVVMMKYTTVDGTALAVKDYKKTEGTLTFASGETSKTISVPVVVDNIPEAAESFKIKLYEIIGAVNSSNQVATSLEATATIDYEPLDLFYRTSKTALLIKDLPGCFYQQEGYCSAAGIGDFNGDAYSDIVIGSSYYNMFRGQASLINGGSAIGTLGELSVNDSSVINITGDASLSYFGSSISTAGDINGDGKADILIGSKKSTPEAHLILSSSLMLDDGAIQSLKETGGNYISKFTQGYTATNIGDFNGDGRDDFALSDSVVTKAYIVYGSTIASEGDLDSIASVKITGPVTQIKGIGDFNNDGYDDLAVSSTGLNNTKGAVYIIFGGSSVTQTIAIGSGLGSNGMIINGSQGYSYFGQSIDGNADVNGDGIVDILIGQYRYGYGNGFYDGAVYILFGGAHNSAGLTFEISSLASSNGASFDGEASSLTGYSVSMVGDMNGDGLDDFAIGGYRADGGKGKVYVVYGSKTMGNNYNSPVSLSSLNGSNGFAIIGENASDELGYVVSSAGDFNADGFKDALVSVKSGKTAYVVYGGDYTNSVTKFAYGSSNLINYGTAEDDSIISGDSNIKIIDAKGGNDVIFGTTNGETIIVKDQNFQKVDGGLAYVSGSFSPNILKFDIAGESINLGDFGAKIRNIQTVDISGSGPNTLSLDYKSVKDVLSGYTMLTIVGDSDDKVLFDDSLWVYNSGGDYYARGNVKLKLAGMPSLPTFYVSNATVVEDAGVGKFKIIRDNANYDCSVVYTITNGTATNGADFDVAQTGTINFYEGELVKEVVVNLIKDDKLEASKNLTIALSSPTSATVSSSAGSATMTIKDDAISIQNLSGKDGFTLNFAGTNDNYYYGSVVNSVGDYNKDGYEDFIVGGNNYKRLVWGGEHLKNSAEFDVTDGTKYAQFNLLYNYNMAPIGDFNGDGYDDFAASSMGYNTNVGEVLIYLGGSTFDASRTIAFTGENSLDYLGKVVSGIGDFNGDGYDDIAVSSYGTSSSGSTVGKVYVVYGRNSSSNVYPIAGNYAFQIDGEASENYFGSQISRGGDINGDGYSDFVISAFYQGTQKNGKAYVIKGSPSIISGTTYNGSSIGDIGFSIAGEGNYNYFGTGVDIVGDMNGDGYDDIAIGAPSFNNQTGKVYVIYGKSGLSSVTLSTLGSSGSDGFVLYNSTKLYLGNSVKYAGDINGDGYDDLLITSTNGSSEPNSVYVVFGNSVPSGTSLDMDNSLSVTQGFKLTADTENNFGENENTSYPSRLSSAGDIDGDGFNDFIIGAPQADITSTNGGLGYVIFGRDFSGRATYVGTNGADSYSDVTPGDYWFYPKQGDDYIWFYNGPDKLFMGQGNDISGGFGFIDGDDADTQYDVGKMVGGRGFDTFGFVYGNTSIDFRNIHDNQLRGYEKLDLRKTWDYENLGQINDSLTITMSKLDILNILDTDQHTFYIRGGAEDSISITDGTWIEDSNDGDVSYRTWNLSSSPIKLKIDSDITTISISGVSQ